MITLEKLGWRVHEPSALSPQCMHNLKLFQNNKNDLMKDFFQSGFNIKGGCLQQQGMPC